MMILFSTEFLNSSSLWNDLLTIVGIIVGVISVLVTVISIIGTLVTLRKSRPKFSKKYVNPCYTYQDKKVNAHVTRIAIWNSGKTLLSTDVIKKAPICINTKNEHTEIIDCSLIYSEEKNDIRHLRASYDKKVITFTFDLLRNNEGFVIDVIHTGYTHDLQVKGSLIEGGDILFIPPLPRRKSIMMTIIGACVLILYIAGFIMLSAGYFSFLIYKYPVICSAIIAAMIPLLISISINLIKSSFSSMFIPQKIDKILFNS